MIPTIIIAVIGFILAGTRFVFWLDKAITTYSINTSGSELDR